MSIENRWKETYLIIQPAPYGGEEVMAELITSAASLRTADHENNDLEDDQDHDSKGDPFKDRL